MTRRAYIALIVLLGAACIAVTAWRYTEAAPPVGLWAVYDGGGGDCDLLLFERNGTGSAYAIARQDEPWLHDEPVYQS